MLERQWQLQRELMPEEKGGALAAGEAAGTEGRAGAQAARLSCRKLEMGDREGGG